MTRDRRPLGRGEITESWTLPCGHSRLIRQAEVLCADCGADPAIKTEQFEHQATDYQRFRDSLYHAVYWEMGLGKAKHAIDVAAHKWLNRMIDCLLVIAPNSVYKNWLTQEMPAHCAVPYYGMAFPKGQYRVEHMMRREIFLDDQEIPLDRLRFVCVSYRSCWTEHGRDFLLKLTKKFRTMTVCDEITAISNPETKQTKTVKEIGKQSAYRVGETGTPATEGPYKVWSPVHFLDPDYWADFRIRNYASFKSAFGVFEQQRAGKKVFNARIGYRDVDRLQRMIAPISSRLLKDDSTVKLPPKVYQTLTFEMTKEQRHVYDALVADFEAELAGGVQLEATLAIVRLARLQQITSGFVAIDEIQSSTEIDDLPGVDPALMGLGLRIVDTARKVHEIVPPSENPRIELLVDQLDAACHKVIVWTKYRYSQDAIASVLGPDRCLRYDGSVKQSEREEVLRRFRDRQDSAQVLLANQAAISMGVTLVEAKSTVYYENGFSLERRLQSEDRNHRIGQNQSVLVTDLAAERTVDIRIIRCHREKFDLQAQIMGDKLREFMQDPGETP